MSKSTRKCTPPRGVWGLAPPRNLFLDSRSSEMGSESVELNWSDELTIIISLQHGSKSVERKLKFVPSGFLVVRLPPLAIVLFSAKITKSTISCAWSNS